MNDDLVERLRRAYYANEFEGLYVEAADEIERLQAKLWESIHQIDKLDRDNEDTANQAALLFGFGLSNMTMLYLILCAVFNQRVKISTL